MQKKEKNLKTYNMEQIEIYIVRNFANQYFTKAKSRFQWTTDINEARIYTKLASARTQVTQWAKRKPGAPIPVIIRMTATVTEVMNEIERVKEAQEKIATEKEAEKIREAKWRLESAQRDLQRAERDMADAKRKLGLL